jgi:Tfp pilus assembly protein PilF
MSSTKTALKAAKAALDAEKYDDAVEQVKKVLTIDPNHYHAYVGMTVLGYLLLSVADQYLLIEAMFSSD